MKKIASAAKADRLALAVDTRINTPDLFIWPVPEMNQEQFIRRQRLETDMSWLEVRIRQRGAAKPVYQPVKAIVPLQMGRVIVDFDEAVSTKQMNA